MPPGPLPSPKPCEVRPLRASRSQALSILPSHMTEIYMTILLLGLSDAPCCICDAACSRHQLQSDPLVPQPPLLSEIALRLSQFLRSLPTDHGHPSFHPERLGPCKSENACVLKSSPHPVVSSRCAAGLLSACMHALVAHHGHFSPNLMYDLRPGREVIMRPDTNVLQEACVMVASIQVLVASRCLVIPRAEGSWDAPKSPRTASE